MSAIDAADRLAIHSLVEDPERWEAAIRAEIARGKTDPAARAVIESIYCDEDRERAFERFRAGPELSRIAKLLSIFQIPTSARICEIGGGGGWLGWGLGTLGYKNLEMLEPNAAWISGTGYLRTRADASHIRIWNDLDAWYADTSRYDLILTHNCVHHFRSMTSVAAAIRRKTMVDGRWLMLREWYADSAEELYRLLRDHPYSQRYGLFEMPYPSSYYVDSLRMAGFSLTAVVPSGYANDVLDRYVPTEGSSLMRAVTRAYDVLLAAAPGVTRRAYETEVLANRLLGKKLRRFSRPQAMLFTRRALEGEMP